MLASDQLDDVTLGRSVALEVFPRRGKRRMPYARPALARRAAARLNDRRSSLLPTR